MGSESKKRDEARRTDPLDRCARGHAPIWNYRSQGCPLCALVLQTSKQQKVIERLQARLDELETLATKVIDINSRRTT